MPQTTSPSSETDNKKTLVSMLKKKKEEKVMTNILQLKIQKESYFNSRFFKN